MRITLLFFILVFSSLPSVVLAAEFFLETDKTRLEVGDEVIITAIVSTQEAANAIEGELVFTPGQFTVKKLYTGGSVLTFWINYPKERLSDTVSFSGITPGGFTGAYEKVLEIHLVADRAGTSTITFANMRLLAHDGLGSDISYDKRPLVLRVEESSDTDRESSDIVDTDPPEPFTPIITSNPDLFDGKSVLIFTTQDKQTGIDSYYVKEYKYRLQRYFSLWQEVESPYVLRDQTGKSFVEVKAIDIAGNERVVSVLPSFATKSTEGLVLVLVLALMITILLGLYRLQRRLLRLRQKTSTHLPKG